MMSRKTPVKSESTRAAMAEIRRRAKAERERMMKAYAGGKRSKGGPRRATMKINGLETTTANTANT
jgi:hypothetical protein